MQGIKLSLQYKTWYNIQCSVLYSVKCNAHDEVRLVFLREEASSASHLEVCVWYFIQYSMHYSIQLQALYCTLYCIVHCTVQYTVHYTVPYTVLYTDAKGAGLASLIPEEHFYFCRQSIFAGHSTLQCILQCTIYCIQYCKPYLAHSCTLYTVHSSLHYTLNHNINIL